MSIQRKIIRANAGQVVSPHSLLIEKTALELAAVFYEAGRSSGMKSKHKNARSFAKAYVERFIPKAVEVLMEMLNNPATPKEQKDMIYDAIMERTNDPELSNIGIPVFKNDTPFTSDRVEKVDPIIINTPRADPLKDLSGKYLNLKESDNG